MVKYGRVSLLEMTPAAHLSPCDLYVAFGCTDLKSGCHPTENVPSWFALICNNVWYSTDACVRINDPISFTLYPEMCVNLQLKIPTNLGPSYALEINQP